MKRIIFLLLCLLCFFVFSADERLNVDVIAVDYPPYTSSKLTGDGSSFILLSKYAQSNFSVSLTPFFLPPARANRVIKDGYWCLSFYPPREGNKVARFVSLSDNVVSMGFYRLRKKEGFHWTELKELKGKIVALLRPDVIGKMHQNILDAGLQMVYVESIEQGLQLVLKNRVDYAFGDNLVLSETNLSEVQKQKLQFSESSVHEAEIGFFYNIECKDKLFNQNKMELIIQ
ncbi:hypothetical protein CXF85_14515 [Colwellia sp. 75C3]|uniref:hypothetical protein n=1 Tax=Colwellia sp. 75C3 TaxID=888425 RepID=UPI000C324DE6|nr:hypothetical protein [Colwellia sp. 75C3]PKG82112.1 hypothetical protein CXF85_14515 [Colwellia sp. 75C3]